MAGKRKSGNSHRKSEFLPGGKELNWRNVTPVSDNLSLLVGSEEGGFLSLEEVDGEEWDLPGLDTAVDRDVGIRSEAEKTLPTTRPGKKRKRRKKGDVDKTDGEEKQKRRKKGVDEAGSLGNADKKGKKPKLGSKARKLLRGKQSGAGTQESTCTADEVSSPNENSGKASAAAEEDGDLPGLDTAVERDVGIRSEAEKTLLTTLPGKKRKQRKKVDGDKSDGLSGEETRKRRKKRADEACSLGNTDKKGKKPKLGSKARKLLRGKQSGAGAQQSSGTADEVSPPNENSGKASAAAEEDDLIDMSGWAEMRLHPKLERALEDLKFSEPTPIQRHCIPAAAHKGKDVIGAAETGSGKTLAFGLPILQRLLDEQEKASNGAGSEDASENVESTSKRERKQGPLRALIISPTRELALQICEHLKAAAKWTNIRVVPIVGGISTQKQQRLLTQMPEIVVGTPGRVWELMSNGETHLLGLQQLSFFVLDEADRMVEKGHFKELQSIIDMLPSKQKLEKNAEDGPGGDDGDLIMKPRKKRQTLVFSATLALPANFKQKLKRGHHKPKVPTKSIESVAALSERAGVSHEAAIVDLTSSSIVAANLSESVVECREEDKDQYLYYILKIHGAGRTIVFCTSIAALRRVTAILRLLQIPLWPLHAKMQQRARLKAMDGFRSNKDCVLVATDVAARGLDVPGIRTVIHYQLPHSAEVYVHRSGRTARALSDGISIALVSPADRAKYLTLCRALSRPEGLQPFPINMEYMPAMETRVSLAAKCDKLLRKQSQTNATQAWLARNAEAMEIDMEVSEDEDGGNINNKSKVASSSQLRGPQRELQELLSQPIKLKAFSNRYITGNGMTPLVTQQLQTLMMRTKAGPQGPASKNGQFVVIGQEQMEPLEALQLSSATPHLKRKHF